MLAALSERPDETVGRDELGQRVWGTYDPSIGKAIDVHVSRLRGKLAAGVVPAPAIVAVRGFGFRLVTSLPAGSDLTPPQAASDSSGADSADRN